MKRKMTLLALIAACLTAAPVRASEVDILVQKLVEKNILTRVDAEEILGEIRRESAAAPAPAAAMAAPAVPSWLDGLTQKGDVRLRYDGIGMEDEDGRDRHRFRFRLRWGLEKKFNDEFRAGFRLASGPRDDATSSNQSFDDEFSMKQINIDRAYAIWTPNQYVKPHLENATVELGGGKVANPYEKWGTSIIFDSDVNPEGAYEKMDYKLTDIGDPANGGRWDLNFLLGQFVLNEESNREDATLYAHGIGTTFAWNKNANLALKYVYYDWHDYDRLVASGSVLTATNPAGNDRSIDGFRVSSVYAEANMPVATWWGSENLKLFGHYIYNHAEGDDGHVNFNEGENQGASAGVTLGQSKKAGDWEAKYQWYYLEANATPGNFTESDLGLGFANNKGHQISYSYRIHDNIQLVGTYWAVERADAAVSSTPFSTTVFEDREISRWQLDVIYSF